MAPALKQSVSVRACPQAQTMHPSLRLATRAPCPADRSPLCRVLHRLQIEITYELGGQEHKEVVDARAMDSDLLDEIVAHNDENYPFPHVARNHGQSGSKWDAEARCPNVSGIVGPGGQRGNGGLNLTPFAVFKVIHRIRDRAGSYTFKVDQEHVDWWKAKRR